MAQHERVMDQWDVVATMGAPAAMVVPWVAWYLEQGAARVHVFFDDPADPAADLIAGTERVTVTRCDRAYWARVGGRPRRRRVRHSRNAAVAYGQCSADWLLHCDVDEFLWPGGPMGALLAGWGPKVGALRIPNVERYWPRGQAQATLFDGRFRRPFEGDKGEGKARFGPDYAMTCGGLTAHGMGKSFCRTGRDYRMKIHGPRLESGERPLTKVARSAVLLHFDGATPLHWVLKLMDRAASAAEGDGPDLLGYRMAQVSAIRASRSFADLMMLHDRLKRPGPEVEAMMAVAGLDVAVDFPVEDAVKTWFPQVQIDLNPEPFDKALRAGAADLLERFRVSSRQA